VSPPNKFPHTLWGWGCWGLVYLHILLSILVTEPGLVPAPGLGACVPGGVRACVAPFSGCLPCLLCVHQFSCAKAFSSISTHTCRHTPLLSPLPYILSALSSYADTAFLVFPPSHSSTFSCQPYIALLPFSRNCLMKQLRSLILHSTSK
jgi:hypothetical protein